jgi:hypothetical protein
LSIAGLRICRSPTAVAVGFEPTVELPEHTLSSCAEPGLGHIAGPYLVLNDGLVAVTEHGRTRTNETRNETKGLPMINTLSFGVG